MNDISNFSSLNHYGLIQIQGEEAESFLQGQLTCDLREVTDSQYRFGAYCNNKGRVLATFRIFKWLNSYFLLMPKSIIENTLDTLKKFGLFSEVEISDVTNQWQIFALTLPSQNTSAKQNCISFSDSVFLHISDEPQRWIMINQINNQNDHKPSPLFSISNSKEWDLFEIRSSIPMIYSETIEMFTPHMLNLPQLSAISFKKGCYVGQEIIARTEYLGKTKREMSYLIIKSEKELVPGETLFDDEQKEKGKVVSAVSLNNNEYEVLIVV